MPIMLSHTYDAFKAAGVSEATARAASQEIAGFENRLSRMELRLTCLEVTLVLVLTGVVSLVLKAYAL